MSRVEIFISWFILFFLIACILLPAGTKYRGPKHPGEEPYEIHTILTPPGATIEVTP